MKKFQFGLDGVLHYKQQLLDGVQNEYAQVLQQVAEQREVLHQAQRSHDAYNEEFRQAKSKGLTIAEALTYERGIHYWKMEIQKETLRLNRLEEQAEEKRQAVVEARQDTASLEKLKEKKLESYQYQVQKGEEQFIEELVMTSRLMAVGAVH